MTFNFACNVPVLAPSLSLTNSGKHDPVPRSRHAAVPWYGPVLGLGHSDTRVCCSYVTTPEVTTSFEADADGHSLSSGYPQLPHHKVTSSRVVLRIVESDEVRASKHCRHEISPFALTRNISIKVLSQTKDL